MKHALLAFAFVAFTAVATPANAQSPSTATTGASWMRYPAISPDGKTIAFTYKGDLYKVASSGGTATPLTTHTANDFMPVWSPDGKQIAFASDRYGNYDIYSIAADGGEARRLTFHSASEYPYSFSGDNKHVIFGAARQDAAANRQYPTGSQPELYEVAATGGRPMQVLTTPAENVKASRNGQFLVYEDKKGGENQWRKHHESSVARDIWMYDRKADTHRQLTTFAGEDRSPVFADNDKSIYYLSERSGSFNVHKQGVDNGAPQQVTTFKSVPVRFLSIADNGTLAFGFDGQIYTMPSGGKPTKLDIAVSSDNKANNERIMAVNSGAQSLVVSPSGREVAFTYRGDVFVNSVEGGGTKRITTTPETENGVEFSPDGKSIAYASERGGKWAIYEARRQRDAEPYFFASTVVKEATLVSNEHQNTHPSYSPDGKQLAYLEDRNSLKVMDVATRQTRTLLTDKELFGLDHNFQWSPDGQWILFDMDVPGIAPGEVGLVRVDGKGEVVNITQSGFNDSRARWVMGGKAMLWFSNRDGLKSVAQSGQTQQDVYGMFFDRDAWERFSLSKDEFALVKEADDKLTKTKADSAKLKADSVRAEKKPLVLDLDGLDARRARFTIHSSALGDALLSKDGETLYYLARFEKGMNLWSTALRTKETKMLLALNSNSGNMTWDKEQKYIFLLADGAISRIDPSTAVPKRDVVAMSGEDALNVDDERAAQFDHVWRRTRDTFYSKGFHGIDWQAIRPVYAKYLPHIGNNFEFAEMMAEMLGELNISHSGATFSTSTPNDDATASIGVFYDPTHTGAGAKVVEIIKDGPLDRHNIDIKPGVIIESVDGVPVTPATDIAALLNRKTGKNVLLSYSNAGTSGEVVIKPIALAEENRLLYARWIKRNADEVSKASNGKLGYVHIPGMNDGAMRTTFEDIMGKYATRAGAVVDTRFNSGGDLVADLAMFLSGKKFFDYTTDTRSSGYEPNFRWTKPTVALANEANYSDGHCFAYAYKDQKLGPLVGMPVPGTCTFAGWESLQDGVRWGVPGLGVKDAVTGKYLENLQTEPDIKVMNRYELVSKGKDQQLEAAIAALLKLVQAGTMVP
ncbi:MAG: PD40 domain-containing protein [Phycisphaerae bacterium]|nr:PD40 domain-containing protein [Gemmatimonadaceae bacterium]